jgi:hypothetical protein
MAEQIVTLPELITQMYEITAQDGLLKNKGPNSQAFQMWAVSIDVAISNAKNDTVRSNQLLKRATNQFMRN